jgi:5-methylcytosine-specific restriction endonuclease McrA
VIIRHPIRKVKDQAVRREQQRKMQLAWVRDGGMCQVPGCTAVGHDVHHIVHRSQGGSDELDNLVTLCRYCHDRVHMLIRGKPLYVRWDGKAIFSETPWEGLQ